MKKMLITFALAIILITPFALATSAFTEFAGSGDLSLKTTIDGSTDFVEVHTGCEGESVCCSCPDYPGSYDGYQFLSNNPFISVTETNVDEGCVDIIKTDTYERNGEITYTETHTGFIGEGSAFSILFRDENEGYSYQNATGDCNSYAFFYQGNSIYGDFDYETRFGGITENSTNGHTEMETHFLLNSPSIIISDLIVECDSFGKCYTTFYVDTSDILAMNAYLQLLDGVEWYSFVVGEGSSKYIIVSESYGSIDFGFVMEAG